MIDLNKLIELAEGATQGEWKADSNTRTVCNHQWHRIATFDGGYFNGASSQKSDAEFVAVANPQTIKKICEVIRVYEEALVNIKASADLGENTKDYFYNCTTTNTLAKGKSILEGE